MTRSGARFVLPVALAALMVAAIAPAAMAWSAGNNCGSTTYKICVSVDDNMVTPRATTNLTDSDYSGDVYFNTSTSINNTVSSIQNWYSNRDVVWYTGSNGSGSALCVDSEFEYSSLGFGWDDAFSSHSLMADDNLCFS